MAWLLLSACVGLVWGGAPDAVASAETVRMASVEPVMFANADAAKAAPPVTDGSAQDVVQELLTHDAKTPKAGTLQVLDRDATGCPTLARLALGHSLPCLWEEGLGMGGTWAYLIADGPGVMICDAGPRYALG